MVKGARPGDNPGRSRLGVVLDARPFAITFESRDEGKSTPALQGVRVLGCDAAGTKAGLRAHVRDGEWKTDVVGHVLISANSAPMLELSLEEVNTALDGASLPVTLIFCDPMCKHGCGFTSHSCSSLVRADFYSGLEHSVHDHEKECKRNANPEMIEERLPCPEHAGQGTGSKCGTCDNAGFITRWVKNPAWSGDQ